jgi:GAF domain-containing protein
VIDFRPLQARYLRALAIASLALAGLALLSALLNGDAPNLGVLIGFLIATAVWWFLLDRGEVQAASYGMLASYLLVVLVNPVSDRMMIAALVAVVTAALLARMEVFVAVNVLILGKLLVSGISLLSSDLMTMPPEAGRVVAYIVMLAFVSVVTRYFRNGAVRASAASAASIELLQVTAEVVQPLAQIAEREVLLERAVNAIRTRYGHYHVQVFLVSETRDQALLVASTGEVGRQLLERGHQLSVGSQSVIGQVILRGTPVLVSDTRREAVYYANDLLPNTRAELALPIRDGSTIVGALDLQSLTPDAFTRPSVAALQVVADLLASALRGARLAQRDQQTQDVNERLRQEAAANRREIERLNQQLTRVAWQEYQAERREAAGITLERDRVQPANDWSEPMLRAGQEARVVEARDSSGGTVAVPVTLRGEVIGAIEVEAGHESDPETVEMVQAVAQRLALSLENARLYQATVEAAAHEQRINDIAARFQSVATVDELMRVALSELGEILGAEQGAIRLGQFTEEQAS